MRGNLPITLLGVSYFRCYPGPSSSREDDYHSCFSLRHPALWALGVMMNLGGSFQHGWASRRIRMHLEKEPYGEGSQESLFSNVRCPILEREDKWPKKRESERERERERKRESVHAWVTTHLSSPSNWRVGWDSKRGTDPLQPSRCYIPPEGKNDQSQISLPWVKFGTVRKGNGKKAVKTISCQNHSKTCSS